MMSFLYVLSLVVVYLVIAHARILTPNVLEQPHQIVTSSASKSQTTVDDDIQVLVSVSTAPPPLATLRSRQQNLMSLEASVVVRTPSSVVQNWSLVCKQLCGAGLGGLPCASYCMANSPPASVQQLNANRILKLNKQLICQDLCKLQPGDGVCNCDNSAANIAFGNILNDRNSVCSSFCDHSNATLTGCTLCKENDNKMMVASNIKAKTNINNFSDSHVAQSFVQFNTTTTTTTATVTATDASAERAATTTPNWNELCATLCKTGDGGSLCNCDLSPFFK